MKVKVIPGGFLNNPYDGMCYMVALADLHRIQGSHEYEILSGDPNKAPAGLEKNQPGSTLDSLREWGHRESAWILRSLNDGHVLRLVLD